MQAFDHASVYEEADAGDVAGGFGGEEDGGVGDFLGGGEPLEGDVLSLFGQLFLYRCSVFGGTYLGEVDLAIGEGVTGEDGVDGDVVGGEFLGLEAGEGDETAAEGAGDGEEGFGLEGDEAGDVDDAAPAGLGEGGMESADHADDVEEGAVYAELPLFVGFFGPESGGRAAGVGDEDLGFAVEGAGVVNPGVDVLFFADVGGEHVEAVEGDGVAGADADFCAFAGEGLGDGEADAFGAGGDEGGFSFEAQIHGYS